MEIERGKAMEENRLRQPPHRLSSRFNTITNLNWKEKLRENCCKRVRDDRMRLLWKTRLDNDAFFHDKEFIKSTFQGIVSDEIKKMKGIKSIAEVNDMLWEYDGVHTVHEGEREEIMLEMQKLFYEDLRKEQLTRGIINEKNTEAETSDETWETEEDEYLARVTFEQMQLNEAQRQNGIWCPVCKQGLLQEDHQRIFCNLCALQLNKGDGVTLDLLRARLAEAHADHLDRGCRLKPKFCLETRFGLTVLYVSCPECSMLEIVI